MSETRADGGFTFRPALLFCLAAAALCALLLALVPRPAAARSGKTTAAAASAASGAYAGYTAAAYTDGGFLAAGTGGRVDRVADGKTVSLKSGVSADLAGIWTDGSGALLCGAGGTVLEYAGGGLRTLRSGGGDLTGITKFGGLTIASAKNGKLLVSQDGEAWETVKLPTERDIVSVAADGQYAMALTAETDVFLSADGRTWTHDNYNDTYRGLCEACVFTKALAFGDSLFVLGHKTADPGVPVILYTETGEVWMTKTLAAIDGEAPEKAWPLTIGGMTLQDDQFLAACSGGRLLTVPDCAKCCKLTALTDHDLRAVAAGDGKILAAGEAFFLETIDGGAARQDKIQAEQARADIDAGAVVIDVRTAAEREETGFVPGSVNIPVDEIAARLPAAVPDVSTEIIFYCAKGARAQKALETARGLGYTRVYNLGGLSDWPYGVSHGE